MSWQSRGGGIFAFVALVLGVLIIFTLVLPPGFWWFVTGIGLITYGVCKLRSL